MKSGKDRHPSGLSFIVVVVLVKEAADGLMPECPVPMVRVALGMAVLFSLGGGDLGDCVKSEALLTLYHLRINFKGALDTVVRKFLEET